MKFIFIKNGIPCSNTVSHRPKLSTVSNYYTRHNDIYAHETLVDSSVKLHKIRLFTQIFQHLIRHVGDPYHTLPPEAKILSTFNSYPAAILN